MVWNVRIEELKGVWHVSETFESYFEDILFALIKFGTIDWKGDKLTFLKKYSTIYKELINKWENYGWKSKCMEECNWE